MKAINEDTGEAQRRSHWRPRGIASALALVLAPALFLLPGCMGETKTPDVILITLDTTRADHLGAYGYERKITPHLDQFAADAVLFERAWSTASWTLPAHASMFTGKHPSSHGATFNSKSADTTLGAVLPAKINDEVKVNRLGEDEVTIAELLREKGYETAAFVGGPWMSPVFGLLQGYGLQDAEIRSRGGRRADELTDRAIAWLRRVPQERPIHLLLNYFDPHGRYTPPPGFDDLPHAKAPTNDIYAIKVFRGKELTVRQRAALVDRYDGEIRFMDHHLGRLLEAMRKVGRYEDALIIILADHGETFGEHDLLEHGRWLYEEVLRVPMIVRFPGGRGSGTVLDDDVSVVDLLPLIAQEADLTVPAGNEGVAIGRRELVMAESFRDALAIKMWGPRFDRDITSGIRWPWKLIVSDRDAAQLYRLDEDPGELHNLADGQKETELRNAMERAKAAFTPPVRSSSPQNVSPKMKTRLRELGYIE